MAEENTRVLLDGWLDGAIRGYAYMMGADSIKNFLKAAAEVAYTHLQEAASAQGLPPVSGANNVEIIKKVSNIEAKLGVLGEKNLEISESSDGLTLTHIGCPYAKVCSGILSDLVSSAKSQTILPCFRAETYMVAAAQENGSKGKYLLKQYAPGEKCTVIVEFI